MNTGSISASSNKIQPRFNTFEQAHRLGSTGRYRQRMENRRTNTDLAALIDLAFDVEIEESTRAAAHFLETNGVRFALTCRVLAEPTRRRHEDAYKQQRQA